MVYAKLFITNNDGSERVFQVLSVEELGHKLNYLQEQIFEQKVMKALVEAVDPLAQPVAEMFNALASDLFKLQETQKTLYKATNKPLT